MAAQSWYVYTLAYPDGTVFYVGKGTKNRIGDHEAEAKRGCICAKCQVISGIWASGSAVQKTVLLETLIESEALTKEQMLISEMASPELMNTTLNPHKPRRSDLNKSEILEATYATRMVKGVEYVSIQELQNSFNLTANKLSTILVILSINRCKFPLIKKWHVSAEEAEEVRRFLLSVTHK